MDIGLGLGDRHMTGSHMVESKAVWKDLGSRRIGKSLEMEMTSRDYGFLMVYTWCAHVQRRLRV